MIPILYEKNETSFASNGLGRLRDCISAVVTEERNGIYELDFEYPVDGLNYEKIQCGRIVAVTHDEGGDVQPFDIVASEKPIDGIVTFHAVHISYRLTTSTVSGKNINSLADAFTMLGGAVPSSLFSYWTDKTNMGFLASADGVPHSVRQVLGGMEGSILDAYGGEYEWDKFVVKLWKARGEQKNFTIRYGVNLVDYNEEVDYNDTYNAVVPYWKGQDKKGNDVIVKGDMQTVGTSFNDVTRCIPLDVTDKFETKPTKAQVETAGQDYIKNNQTYLPAQTIEVDFVRLGDSDEYAQFAGLQKCKLCDSIRVVFSRYNMEGTFKIVKTEYDVLKDRYSKLELGTLSTTLAESLGINPESATKLYTSPQDDYVTDQGYSGNWQYTKWESGKVEMWGSYKFGTLTFSSSGNLYRSVSNSFTFASDVFDTAPQHGFAVVMGSNTVYVSAMVGGLTTTGGSCEVWKTTSGSATDVWVHFYLVYNPTS